MPKPTDGLEYTYIRKPASSMSDRKELAHLWEVAGTSELSQEVFGIRNILAPEQVKRNRVAELSCLTKLTPFLQHVAAPTMCRWQQLWLPL